MTRGSCSGTFYSFDFHSTLLSLESNAENEYLRLRPPFSLFAKDCVFLKVIESILPHTASSLQNSCPSIVVAAKGGEHLSD